MALQTDGLSITDLFIGPLYLLIFFAIAYQVRPMVTNKFTRKYFIPAFALKMVGGLGFALVFTLYYGSVDHISGDTGNYFQSSSVIYKAFWDSPSLGLDLLMNLDITTSEAYRYRSNLNWYNTPRNFFVIQIASIFNLLSFNSYIGVTLFFAAASFTGIYALYVTLIKLYPRFHKEFAIAVFFIPSLFFWGSGLMKDTICLGCIGWAFWAFYQGFIEKKKILKSLFILFIALGIIQIVKVYILLCFIPAAVLWVFLENSKKIKNPIIRIISKPILIVVGAGIGYFASTSLTEESRYSVENVAETAATTSNYLERQTLRKAGTGRRTGSEYYVGKLDGSTGSMITAAPQAIFVALFRPFIFETRNPVMLLSALEATWFLWLALTAIYKIGLSKLLKFISSTPLLAFCFSFAIIFGLGVGLTSGNFGTLVRYRIPLIPFFAAALLILKNYSKLVAPKVRKNYKKVPPNLRPV